LKLGPRAAAHAQEYAQLLDDINAGVRLHYASDGTDADLDLLLGDQRYAHGLLRLAELGDLEATIELGDLISLLSQAHAAGDAALADAIWQAGVAAVGWGTNEQLESAKNLARAGNPDAAEALLAAAAAITEGSS
jgi:hypothetical protein